jgi:UDP-N-acetylmuramyl pentapeptide synthase
MESYLAAKLKLGSMVTDSGVEVVNLDDDAWRVLPERSRRVTFGLHPAADVRADGVVVDAAGSRFRLGGCFGSAEISLPRRVRWVSVSRFPRWPRASFGRPRFRAAWSG